MAPKKQNEIIKILIGIVVFNEEKGLPFLLDKVTRLELSYPFTIVFVNDGSCDKSSAILMDFIKRRENCLLLENKVNRGVGYSIRKLINYGLRQNFSICTIMAGNGKDNPLEIPKLIKPIIKEDYDYIQGSRFLKGGSFKNLPFLRKLLIKGFTFVVWILTGFKGTDATNGFRAYKLSLLKDKRININQRWLDRYELETYLHFKVITLGYKIKEVPVSKDYLPHVKKYSHIKPFIDWWRIARPLFLLKLRIKR